MSPLLEWRALQPRSERAVNFASCFRLALSKDVASALYFAEKSLAIGMGEGGASRRHFEEGEGCGGQDFRSIFPIETADDFLLGRGHDFSSQWR